MWDKLAAICFFSSLQLIRGVPLEELSEIDTRPPCPCGLEESSINTRVVGGHIVGRNRFPYASNLIFGELRDEREMPLLDPFCGGTLITDRHVLTAAHCLKEHLPNEISVDVGDYNLSEERNKQILNSIKLTKYPDYIPGRFHTDIGIVELERPVKFHPGMRTAPLVSPDFELKPGTTVQVFGWGRLSYYGEHPDKLHAVSLPVIDNKKCQKEFISRIEPTMICAGGEAGRDACIGDSGSGLVVQLDNEYVLCGVVSFGKRCALPHVPGVYTRISSFVDWIQENTRSASCRPCVYGA